MNRDGDYRCVRYDSNSSWRGTGVKYRIMQYCRILWVGPFRWKTIESEIYTLKGAKIRLDHYTDLEISQENPKVMTDEDFKDVPKHPRPPPPAKPPRKVSWKIPAP